MEMDCGEMIDLTGLNDSDTMTDAELAERLQMEELETMNQSDFEVARHLQEMERRHAASSHMIPELFMFGEPMRRMNSGYRAESRRLRPPRPLPPRPTRVTRTSNSDEHDTDSNDLPPPSTDNNPKDDDDDVTSHNDHQTTAAAAAAAAASAPPSRSSMARRAQLAMNRNRGDPSACTDGTSTEPDHLEDAVNHRDPAAATAAAQDTRAIRMDRLFGAMNRNRRSHPSVFLPPPDFPATDDEQSRGTVCQTRSRSMRGAPPLPTAHRPHNAEESRDALNHNHSNPTTSTAPSTDDAAGDAEQQDRGVIPPPPVPPRRQRRPPRNRRMFGGSVSGHGLVPFALHHADYHDTLGLPGWAPVRRHYEFSRLLDDDDGSGNNYEALWALSEQIGDAANKGLNLIQITRLPTMKYKASSSSLSSSTVTSDDMMTCDDAVSSSSSLESMSDATLASMETVCRVCLCGFENDEVLRSLPCCHRFHVDCIDQWIKQNAICPVCRDNIKDHLNGGGRGGGGAGGGGDQWDQYQ